jgi:hypothetical protein
LTPLAAPCAAFVLLPLQALSRRGCHASALEVTKLLLGLDPEDPMGGLLLLDYLALRAGEANPQCVVAMVVLLEHFSCNAAAGAEGAGCVLVLAEA